jgi:hypothetical protein
MQLSVAPTVVPAGQGTGAALSSPQAETNTTEHANKAATVKPRPQDVCI